ncbi:MAG: hypothetical protein KGQ59_04545, partial [Bdellovibrionales bacterium]|nr:hypothetical protein [Bdellovibrionales bacterium]
GKNSRKTEIRGRSPPRVSLDHSSLSIRRTLALQYCTKCRDTTGIGNIEGLVEKKDLIQRGVCTRCGTAVTRLIESQ